MILKPPMGLRYYFSKVSSKTFPSISQQINYIREGFKKKKKYGNFHTLVGWVGLKKSFSIKNKNKKHGLKMPKIA